MRETIVGLDAALTMASSALLRYVSVARLDIYLALYSHFVVIFIFIQSPNDFTFRIIERLFPHEINSSLRETDLMSRTWHFNVISSLYLFEFGFRLLKVLVILVIASSTGNLSMELAP